MTVIDAWFGRAGFMPHGYCFTWTPGLLWSMVAADGLIAAAYYSIPVVLLQFVRKRRDSSFNGVALLFSAFIFACGTTHLLAIWTIWVPDYGIEALAKLLTAAVSVATAIVLWPLLPKALRIPSVKDLQQTVALLETEVRQRRQAEDELERTQERLAITLSSIGAGILSTDGEGRVSHMNPLAEQITGWTLAQARGRSLWEVWQREGRPPDITRENAVRFMLDSGTAEDTVHRVTALSRDGRPTPVEVKAAFSRNSAGEVNGLTLVFRDMTRLDRAEIESRQLAAIVESSADAIVGKTLDGRITHWNRAAETLFGYAADEIVGQPITRLIPADRHAEEGLLLSALTQGVKIPPFNTVRLHKDGRQLDVSVTISPVQDHTGRVVGASKIARDISEQKRNDALRLEAERLEAENRQIHETNRLKTEFLANMSHELRTPLNAIIGFADLLHAGRVAVESPKFQEFLGHIRASGRHLLQLINDVLDLSKVEAGKFEFFPEPVDLPQLVRDAVSLLRTEAARKGVHIESSVAPELVGLQLDASRFKQVLFNYLSNAIKFTPQGGQVKVRALPEDAEHFRIEVEDTGIGIAPADLPRLFTQFLQLESGHTKRYEGTGLGLALTRRLVEAQGGTVGARSELGVGSVFHAILPRVGRSDRSDGPPPIRAGSGESSGPRVLVIEDDVGDRGRLMRALASHGFSVDTAPNGERAIQLASRHRYAAITLDLILPDRMGLDVLATIREQGLNRDVPVVVVTVLTDHDAVAGFPVADVLAKPIREDQVREALRKIGLLGQPGASPPRVLVVDDDAAAVSLMAAVIQGAGMDVVCRQDARLALDEIDAIRPDAVVLDLLMPGCDGFTFLDALRSRPAWRSTPVFVWTNMALQPQDYQRLAQSAGILIAKGGEDFDGLVRALSERTRLTVAPAAGEGQG